MKSLVLFSLEEYLTGLSTEFATSLSKAAEIEKVEFAVIKLEAFLIKLWVCRSDSSELEIK